MTDAATIAGLRARTVKAAAAPSAWYCGVEACDGEPHGTWVTRHARSTQVPPADDWLTWLILAGRGWGKTRTGAEFIADRLRRNDNWRAALIGSTFADGRDTMVEGESGLLRVLPPSALYRSSAEQAWNRTLGELRLANGAQAKLYTSERPRQLRGPQHHVAWGDEPFHWADAHLGDTEDTTWSNLLLGLRLGPAPQVVLTSTPKRVRLLIGTEDRPGVLRQSTTRVTKGSTYENLANLAPTFAAQVLSKYEGTTLGRQELHAEVIEDVDGALWTSAVIEMTRRTDHPDLSRIVVAVDPAVTGNEHSDETGIVVAGMGTDREFYVLADRSLRASPDTWARAAVKAYDDYSADRVVAERNNGGELVDHVLRTVRPLLSIRTVYATRGKRTRAEPVAALYEQGKVHHVGSLPVLEDQMTTWVPGEDSPDRMDALVWALTDLTMHGPAHSATAARMRLPTMTGDVR